MPMGDLYTSLGRRLGQSVKETNSDVHTSILTTRLINIKTKSQLVVHSKKTLLILLQHFATIIQPGSNDNSWNSFSKVHGGKREVNRKTKHSNERIRIKKGGETKG